MAFEKSMQSLACEEKVLECPDCGGDDLIFDKGERVCLKCGLVID
jgi:hypothetical protein